MSAKHRPERFRGVVEQQAQAIREYWRDHDVNVWIEVFRSGPMDWCVYCIRSDIGERMRF